MYYENNQWCYERITVGEPKEPRQSYTSEKPGSGDYWGTGNADAGKVGTDPFAYIVTFDPFHGTTLCVYTKEDRGLKSQKWRRHTLDIFGTPTQRMKWGDGPGHFVVCGDFDGDGDDEILLSIFGSVDRDEKGDLIPARPGPNPNKGIVYYKALDLANGIFARWNVSNESSARIALGNFAGTDSLDFASITYNVKNYYEEPNPRLTLHVNQNLPTIPKNPVIIPSLWNKEGIVYLRNPKLEPQIQIPASMPLIEIAGYLISVEVCPKAYVFTVEQGEGIKVLYGSISLLKEGKIVETRSPFSVTPFTRSTTKSICRTACASEEDGAIVLRLLPVSIIKDVKYPTVSDVPVHTKLNPGKLGVSLPPLAFERADKLWWGRDDPFYKDVNFWNLQGFHLRFLDSELSLVHIQFWGAGTRVNGGVHNHARDIFCEIHVALSAGTRSGGMSRLKKEYEKLQPEEYNKLGNEAFDHISLDPLDEHGGLWERDSYGKPMRTWVNAVKYPWHKWQSGDGPDVDVWMALEFNPDL
jgi:aldos-2-ulose dehydratase